MIDRNNNNDRLIFGFIYFAALIVTLRFALLEQVITSDQIMEYDLYLGSISNGWQFVGGNIVNSSLLATLLPAYLQKLLNLGDTTLIFKVVPCFFFSFMPPFVYLICRRYFDIKSSTLVAFFILSHFYFAVYPAVGRVSIAWGIFAIVIYSLLNRKYKTTLICAVLLIFAHYATVYILAVFAITAFFYAYEYQVRDLRLLGLLLVVLGVGIGVWYFAINHSPGGYALGFIHRMLLSMDWIFTMDLSKHENVTRVILGYDIHKMYFIQIVYLATAWTIFSLMAIGLFISLKERLFDNLHRFLGVIAFGLILLTLVNPQLSKYYGIARVYFTGMVILAPMLILGIQRVSKWTKVDTFLIWSVVIIFHPAASPF